MPVQGWTPRRRHCSLCSKAEATAQLHLGTIMIDGRPARACQDCRSIASGKIFYCQLCREAQGGQRYERGGLVICARCHAASAPLPG